MDKLLKFNANKLEGVDASVDISLGEYGFGWIKSDCGTEYQFWYGTKIDDHGDFIAFDWCSYGAKTDVKEEWCWAEWDEIFMHLGIENLEEDQNEWFGLELPQKVYDLLNYYGYENMFGSTYH